MGNMTVRNLPDDVHRRLKFEAVKRGVSAEEAARQLLDEATRPEEKIADIITSYVRQKGEDFPDIKRNQETISAAAFE